jgi:Ca2+-binding RTX toxin-like protein
MMANMTKRSSKEVHMANVYGTTNSDYVSTTSKSEGVNAWTTYQRDWVEVYEGDDVVYAGGGNDYVDGWTGDDTLYGESSADTLLGYDGTDELYGGSGNDELNGERDRDDLYGGTGIDQLYGGAGADNFYFEETDAGDVFNNKADTIYDFNGYEGDAIWVDTGGYGTRYAGNDPRTVRWRVQHLAEGRQLCYYLEYPL